jgi:hypothetical protein
VRTEGGITKCLEEKNTQIQDERELGDIQPSISQSVVQERWFAGKSLKKIASHSEEITPFSVLF